MAIKDSQPSAARRSIPARLFRVLRTALLALLFAFLVGFVIGTFLRRDLEQPVRYIGAEPTPEMTAPHSA